jgi:N-acyl-D-aspartate/D-glutamate deacylase
MHDFLIRNALLLDGLGSAPAHGDLAVRDGRIAALGRDLGSSRETLDAKGLALMPGIIDTHTHYDAQLTWDPGASPSPALGVTTAIIGNCGFTIAPCRPRDRERIMRNLTHVEGMALDVLRAGIRWEFETVLAEDLDTVFTALLLNSDEQAVGKMLRHPASLVSLSDAGAHLTFFNDAGFGLHLLGHWVREREALTLGEAARKLTGDAAGLFGIRERGVLRPGYWADLMLFDPSEVNRGPKQRVRDLPGNGARLMTPALGVHGVWVNGVRVAGAAGALALDRFPGKLMRDFSA